MKAFTLKAGTIPVLVEEFDGWSDLLDHATKPAGVNYGESSMTDPYHYQWTLTRNFEAAVRLAKEGWPDGLAATDVELRNLTAALPKGDDLVVQYTEAGDEPDVGLYLEGEPENMIEFPLRPVGKPVAKLVVSVCYSSGIPAEAITRRGAVVMAVVDALEAMGVRMEIIADWTGTAEDTFCYRVPVKHAEEPMDRDRVAFALCHPSMLRRFMFRLNELTESRFMRRGGGSYGSPRNPLPEPDAFVMPCMHYETEAWRSPATAALEARRIIAEILKLTDR